MNSWFVRGALCLALLTPLGCTVGEGEGDVTSDMLHVADCWDGPFDLGPDFFGANPDPGESLIIRVQRGDNVEDVSDGLIVTVYDLPYALAHLNEALLVGMPRGVTPSGVPIVYNPDPPKVSLALYLHNTCHQQNGTIYSIGGADSTITLSSLFSGDIDEASSEKRLTDATFSASFADPRELADVTDAQTRMDLTSIVTGHFRFFFQRGQPSQPFQ